MPRNQHDKILYLSHRQRELLGAVLDSMVPANDGLPGAGELGVAEHVEGFAGLTPHTRRLLSEGLKAIDVTSARVPSRGFKDLLDSDKADVLKQVESDRPNFFDFLVQQTYAGYYTNPRLLRTKGLSLRAPQPDGFELDEFDAALLDNVRKRGKAYRDA